MAVGVVQVDGHDGGPAPATPSWAWATTSPMPPTWSTWPWVVRRATRRSPFSRSRWRITRGSGGASTRTHSPPGPSGATIQALVPASHSRRPSIMPDRRSSTRVRREPAPRPAVEGPGDAPGAGGQPSAPPAARAGRSTSWATRRRYRACWAARARPGRRRGRRSAAGTGRCRGPVYRPATTSSGGASAATPVMSPQPAGTSASVASSLGSMPRRRWSSRSEPVHRPAMVGRSWVVTAARARSGYVRRAAGPRTTAAGRTGRRGRPSRARTWSSTVPRSSPTT